MYGALLRGRRAETTAVQIAARREDDLRLDQFRSFGQILAADQEAILADLGSDPLVAAFRLQHRPHQQPNLADALPIASASSASASSSTAIDPLTDEGGQTEGGGPRPFVPAFASFFWFVTPTVSAIFGRRPLCVLLWPQTFHCFSVTL